MSCVRNCRTIFGTLFRRQAMEIASTNVGGNAWNTNSTEVRAITRLDAVTTDDKAVVAAKISLTDPEAGGGAGKGSEEST